ncbi:signal recognition particle-docking protein FtsY [Tabrizicola sp.]|uniref:signal recognition particle-docking protein FtsY n=1 Tax=Tabrizicola sp. TaxID=2005166 RepID=UPI003F41155C
MSFFKKLKDRLFRSSDKIGEGLDALVAEGAEAQDGASGGPREPVREVPEPVPEVPEPDVPEIPQPMLPEIPEPAVPELPGIEPEPEWPEPEEPDWPEPEERNGSVAPEVVARTAEPVPVPEVLPAARVVEPVVEAAAAKPGLLGRLFGRGTVEEPRRVLDDAMLESLEELLIQADMGVDTAVRVTANIAEGRFGRKVSTRELKSALAGEVARIMEPVARPMPLYPQKPQVVLVVGVNGSGKTTTIGKLASQFKAAGKSVVIAAGDTFRAAAVEQLQIWGSRAGVPVLTAPEGSDPASLAFDALTKARADGADLLMIDTAGRLQNRADLMEELAKIVRVIRKVDPTAPHNTLLVLDATTGQNALTQVDIFRKIADVSGLVMTKLDGTAKGGVLVALADKFGLPIHAIGVGEQIDDLAPFDPEEFAKALVGAGE